MNPLLRHVACLVFAHDALAIARGTGWERLYVRQTSVGGGGGEVAYRSGTKAITVTRSPDGPGVVTWAEFADFIRTGLTDDLAADLKVAMADWHRFNHRSAERGDLTYESITARFREMEARIVANALAADDHAVQLDLFEVVA
jgi:hypothetical protein